MAKIYAKLIQNGTINPKTGKAYTIDDVPERLREEVRRLLNIPEETNKNAVKDIDKVVMHNV